MAIEKRGGKTYYYRAKRVDGRVVKEYIGRGEFAELVCKMDRAEAERDKLNLIWFRMEWEDKQEQIEAACRDLLSLARLYLMVAGYHRHNYGEWRKKRMAENRGGFVGAEIGKSACVVKDGQSELEAVSIAESRIPGTRKERFSFVQKAFDSKNKETIATAIAIARKHPEEFSTPFLNDARNAIERLCEGNGIAEQFLLNEADRERKKLFEGKDPATIPYAERLLIERVIVCHFALTSAEGQSKGSMTLAKADYVQRTIDRAHKRYLSAIEMLARVRRLSLPTMAVALPGSTQVNIGEKQVNFSSQ